MLIDTHAHLFWDSYKNDLDQVIQRSVDAGISTIINVGVDVKLSRKAEQQTIQRSNNLTIYSSIGIHPHEAHKYSDNQKLAEDIAALEKIYHENPEKVIGVGECGLDYLFDSSKQLQHKLFKAQIDLAKKLNLPLLIHCRDDRSVNFQNTECWDEVIKLTKDYKGIYHCYSGLLPTTSYILKTTNFLVSFAGNLTYPKNDYLKEAVKILPLERIVLETDCPFLPPQSIRGKRNEPSSVREIAQCIAEIKNEPLEKVAEITTQNVKRLFGLGNL